MFYQDETVRLLRELPELQLLAHAEGTLVRLISGEDGTANGAEVKFLTASGAVTAALPFSVLEPLLSRTHYRTAAFWELGKSPAQLVEAAMSFMLDRGFAMHGGVNVVQLQYVSQERWWKWGERLSDPTGAYVVAAANSWDGAVVALSGTERFQLEFRLAGRRGPHLLLHERDDAYGEQSRKTASAMSLARVLLNLNKAIAAEYCAFPVAGAWLADEDWPSLLRPPHYADFFLLPETATLGPLEPGFQTVKMTDGRTMVTVFPVKSSPADPPVERSDRELRLDALRKCTALGEKYYDQLYESSSGVTGTYASAKDAFYDAISLANDLGFQEESERLSNRLAHIKAVFRSQFS